MHHLGIRGFRFECWSCVRDGSVMSLDNGKIFIQTTFFIQKFSARFARHFSQIRFFVPMRLLSSTETRLCASSAKNIFLETNQLVICKTNLVSSAGKEPVNWNCARSNELSLVHFNFQNLVKLYFSI